MGRASDERQEKIVTKYIRDSIFPGGEVVEDRTRQCDGIDIVYDGVNYDVKAQTSYINHPAPTFTLELLFTDRRGTEHIGWFIQNNKTEKYVFCWFNHAKTNDNNEIVSADDIYETEVVVVDKYVLRERLVPIFKQENILVKSREMREKSIRHIKLDCGLKLVHTPWLYEKPVNIIVTKEMYVEVADAHYIIKNGVAIPC